MAIQINTSKWSPSDALRQRVVGAMEREAQYRTAEIRATEAARKDVVTAGAMSDYQTVAANPNATRDQVYGAAQTAFGRLLGVDMKAAKEFATMSGQYPKWNPTPDTEIEYVLSQTKNKTPEEAKALLISYYDRIIERKQANILGAGTLTSQVGPNGVVVTTNTPVIRTPKGNVPAKPEVKVTPPQSATASGATAQQKRVADALKAVNALQALEIKNGYGPLDEASRLWQQAVKDDPAIATALEKSVDEMSNEELLAKAKTMTKNNAQSLDAKGMRQYVEQLQRGRDWIKLNGDYNAAHEILNEVDGLMIDPDTHSLKSFAKGQPRALRATEKVWLNESRDWSKATEAELMQFANPDHKDRFVPSAAKEVMRRRPKNGVKPYDNNFDMINQPKPFSVIPQR
jgi:hypothetical protein